MNLRQQTPGRALKPMALKRCAFDEDPFLSNLTGSHPVIFSQSTAPIFKHVLRETHAGLLFTLLASMLLESGVCGFTQTQSVQVSMYWEPFSVLLFHVREDHHVCPRFLPIRSPRNDYRPGPLDETKGLNAYVPEAGRLGKRVACLLSLLLLLGSWQMTSTLPGTNMEVDGLAPKGRP